MTIEDYIIKNYPDRIVGSDGIPKKFLLEAMDKLGYDWGTVQDKDKISFGIYNFRDISRRNPSGIVSNGNEASSKNIADTSEVNNFKYEPLHDPISYVKWGFYDDLQTIVTKRVFFPVFISGLSGNGKTLMVKEVCRESSISLIRIQISPDTDETDLIGSLSLSGGNTIFAKGPVIRAMETGSILLIDEIDRGTNKIMCLQGILEGTDYFLKKTGEIIMPRPGFNVIATANTLGKGSPSGHFSAANILDEAFLERFKITFHQQFAPESIETDILIGHFKHFSGGYVDSLFVKYLIQWAQAIRKTYFEGGISEVISTRRLCHIIESYVLFKDRKKAIEYCISRFDDEIKGVFFDLYTKVDSSVKK